MSWQDAVLPLDATLQDAITCLNYTGLQIVLVCAPGRILAGTLTDGDIRRGLIRGLTLGSSLDSIFKPDPLVVPPEMGRETVLQLMRANGFGAIPVVDAARHVVGLHLLNRLLTPNRRSNLMVIMAGGKGTRLLPRTQDCPKPLLRSTESRCSNTSSSGPGRKVFSAS